MISISIFLLICIVLTIICLIMMFRPSENSGGYIDFTTLFRAFWTIPILLIWLVYFAFN